MKRIHLFEFEDLPWFPDWIRQCMTNYIQSLHRALKTDASIAPLLQRGLAGTDSRIVDLCSGAGGPMIDAVQTLRSQPEHADLKLVLTDLYPHVQMAQSIHAAGHDWLRYETKSIDAANVPGEMTGLRTMICSLHHMPPDIARGILQDAATKKQPFLAFEISDNSPPIWLWWVAIPVGFLLTLVMSLRVRPLSFRQLFFTYCIPLVPIFIAWDGAVSNARTYTQKDLNELLQPVDSEGYTWEINTIKSACMPSPMLYLLGTPLALHTPDFTRRSL